LITPYFNSKPAEVFMFRTVYMGFVKIEMCMAEYGKELIKIICEKIATINGAKGFAQI